MWWCATYDYNGMRRQAVSLPVDGTRAQCLVQWGGLMSHRCNIMACHKTKMNLDEAWGDVTTMKLTWMWCLILRERVQCVVHEDEKVMGAMPWLIVALREGLDMTWFHSSNKIEHIWAWLTCSKSNKCLQLHVASWWGHVERHASLERTWHAHRLHREHVAGNLEMLQRGRSVDKEKA